MKFLKPKIKNYKKLLSFISIYLFFFIVGDVIFSNFFYDKPVKYGCIKKYEYFFELEKNCNAHEKLIAGVSSYKVYTNSEGHRFNGKKSTKSQEQTAVFFGASYTYGWGLDYEKTFVGILDNFEHNYFIKNLSVPAYSPTAFYYQAKQIRKKKKFPDKIFLVLDQSYAMKEANQWKKTNDDKPQLLKKNEINKGSFWKNFKYNNLKITRLISININSFFRKVKYKIKARDDFNNNEIPVNSFWADFIHTEWSKLNQDEHWEPYGIEGGLKRIEEKIYEISLIAKEMNSEFYIIIYPWIDTLHNGQKYFNWEDYAKKICKRSQCTDLINLFSDFKKYKLDNKNWATDLYLRDDPHWTEKAHQLVAKKVYRYLKK